MGHSVWHRRDQPLSTENFNKRILTARLSLNKSTLTSHCLVLSHYVPQDWNVTAGPEAERNVRQHQGLILHHN